MRKRAETGLDRFYGNAQQRNDEGSGNDGENRSGNLGIV